MGKANENTTSGAVCFLFVLLILLALVASWGLGDLDQRVKELERKSADAQGSAE